MKTEASGLGKGPQPVSNDNTIFVVKNNKITGYFNVFTPKKCEFYGCRITNHDRIEAPYANGRYLCAMCRAEYMDLHHSDPFRVINPKEASV